MVGNNSLVNLGELSKPATVLIEKISDAIGGIFEPYQIERVTKAQVKAKKLNAVADIQITQLQKRALNRLLKEEANKQKNIESIAKKSLSHLDENAQPKDIENDWIVNFFDKGKMISDSEMQGIWSKILAGEANKPGTFSKRTISMLASLDKSDAVLFNSLSNFVWKLGENIVPVVFDLKDKIYNENGINFASIKHLDSIGLISLETLTGYVLGELPKNIKILYKDRTLSISFSELENNKLNIGLVLFTSVGADLYKICQTKKIEGFMDYVVNKWKQESIDVSGS